VWYEVRTGINNQEPLFRRHKAFVLFAAVFRETMLRFVFKIRGLRIEEDRLVFYIKPENGLELPEIMKWMKQVFAQRYNQATGRTGHIWGDRYWSRIVEGEPPEVDGEGEAPGESATGDRPYRGKNEVETCFPPPLPRPPAPPPGLPGIIRPAFRISVLPRLKPEPLMGKIYPEG
jgi:REP element-mobilizing transposase RayT